VVEYYEPTIQESTQTAKNTGKIEAFNILASERVAYYTKVLAFVTGGLAFFGVVQVYFLIRADDTTAGVARAAKASADVAERTLFYANRAYVDVSGMHNEWNKAGHPATGEVRRLLKFRVGVINRGNTPALKFNLSVGIWQSLEAPTVALFDGLDKNIGEGYVSPGTEVLSMDFFISEADVRAVHAGTEKFWVFIHIAYRDVFEETPDHTFQACRQLFLNADPDLAWNSVDMAEPVPDIIRWVPDDTFTVTT